jgi:hypothetical protein
VASIILCWLRELHGPDGAAAYGLGLSEREAAADAWVGNRSLGTLLDAVLDDKSLPLPDGRWTFELHPPGAWERTFAVHTTTTTTST